MKIEHVILPHRRDGQAWDIEVLDGTIHNKVPSQSQALPSLLLPALCHPHVHLDKPYILTSNCGHSSTHPDYSDLAPESGSFSEALSNTSKAKERYTGEDLYLRGSQLLAESYKYGVASLRAFVELDHVTNLLPLTVAIKLKTDFSHLLDVQICAFAQDPIFSTENAERNRLTIATALKQYAGSIDALGTTPYVESSREAALRNIEWGITTALENNIHLDFHLDYNLDASATSKPLAFSVVDALIRHRWTQNAGPDKTIVLGHCTQLTNLHIGEFETLVSKIISNRLPLHFVGLPTSDLFMMGRPSPKDAQGVPHSRPRGTLQIPSLINDHGLSACIGINNVGNAFTPYGTVDPVQLASWGVGIYQAGTLDDAELLYSCVSWRARDAIGLRRPGETIEIVQGSRWPSMLLIKNELNIEIEDNFVVRTVVPARQRMGYKDVVWDPPETRLRSLLR